MPGVRAGGECGSVTEWMVNAKSWHHDIRSLRNTNGLRISWQYDAIQRFNELAVACVAASGVSPGCPSGCPIRCSARVMHDMHLSCVPAASICSDHTTAPPGCLAVPLILSFSYSLLHGWLAHASTRYYTVRCAASICCGHTAVPPGCLTVPLILSLSYSFLHGWPTRASTRYYTVRCAASIC